jgi:hypothetical protein
MGDASRAYSGTIARDQIARQMEKYGVKQTPEYGFGDAGLKTFRRHMFMLRPGIAVIYDELEAEKPVEFTWLSNARCLMEANGNNGLTLNSQMGKAEMKLYSSASFEQNISDKFKSPPVDWQGKGDKMVKSKATSYHYKAVTNKVKKARFLAIIQVGDKSMKPLKIEKTSQGYKVGEWLIDAELDTNKTVAFEITNGKDAMISMGHEKVKLGSKTIKPKMLGSTLLVEKKADGTCSVQEEIDQLPKAAIYY